MLAGIKDDLLRVLALVPGGFTAQTKLEELEAYIRSEAEKGARQAIPEIRRQVKQEAENAIKPYVLASLGLGALGLLAGISATIAAFRRRE